MTTQAKTDPTDSVTPVGRVTSVLIGTRDVDRLHRWYAEVLPPRMVVASREGMLT